MAFLRSHSVPEIPSAVQGQAVSLRAPAIGDYVEWAELRAMSRDHLTPWEPVWPRDDLTRSAYKRRVRHYQRESWDDKGYAYSIFRTADERLVGGITLSNVQRGVTQSATVGYWLGVPFCGQGLMTDAVCALVPFCFETLRLHRLEAATQPSNLASIRVLERSGFEREGFARGYLKINGAWQDHILFGLVAPGTRGPLA
jgi:[ribosomal protein S5]-alanine N-acetyltransferase